ncbi:hypothetical protein M8C21_007898 [Ambrosia artemisiifolia]|uniref:Uncharacterized protein n=1 Tax=Ambrosia artemisiifolia TaxID=4212 RepID=A0AAD5GX44_AMBAR|nr:hypothetical protein M8C21_007898 [Ambrosia artemisiifolia]
MMVTKVKVKSDDGDVRTNKGFRHPPLILSHSGNTTTPVTMVARDGVTKVRKRQRFALTVVQTIFPRRKRRLHFSNIYSFKCGRNRFDDDHPYFKADDKPRYVTDYKSMYFFCYIESNIVIYVALYFCL